MFDDKIVLITGGTGSFGQMFTELLLKEYSPRAVRIYSRGELLQVLMQKKFHDDRLRFFIGDVRDPENLHRAMKDVDIVVHAAALKHVPICEYNPIEAVKTNINGTINAINAALDNDVKKFMLISSDKAVYPVNLYGATKMVAEKVVVQTNFSYAGGKMSCSCVRYGNVLCSRGSVIPMLKEQVKTGTVLITDERMTRFWITLESGARFVMRSLQDMRGGEIFIPKIPSMRIMDIVETIAPDAKRKKIGIRPGEKLNEVLLTSEEAAHTVEFNDRFIVQSEFGKKFPDIGGVKPRDGFIYASDTNDKWMTKEELENIIGTLRVE